MDEFGLRPLCPTPRGGVDLIWKDADGNRDGDVLRGEKGKFVFPTQTSRRGRRVRQPVEGNVVENVISRKALGLAGKDARHERLTGFVVVEYPGRQADGRVGNPVKRLWAVPHLESAHHLPNSFLGCGALAASFLCLCLASRRCSNRDTMTAVGRKQTAAIRQM